MAECTFTHRQRGCETPCDVEAVVSRQRQHTQEMRQRAATLPRPQLTWTQTVKVYLYIWGGGKQQLKKGVFTAWEVSQWNLQVSI